MTGQGLDGGSWAVQQLAGLLAGISAYDDEPSMLTGAAHRIAEAIDAEVCAIVAATGEVKVAVGFPAQQVPAGELQRLVDVGGGTLEVEGLGGLQMHVIALPHEPASHVVVARSSTDLDQDDLHLVRSMGQVLTLALELRRTADRERELRERSESQADALRRANAALLEASRTKDMIISVASHELRTPLTSILGFASTLREHGDVVDRDSRIAYLDIIERQGQRLLRLIDDLLTVGRIEAGHTRPRQEEIPVMAAMRVLVGSSAIAASVEGAADAIAWVDPGHLDQMVLNLLTNAQKYGAAPIRIEVQQGADVVTVAVVDAGDGVPAAFESDLFERFTQASSGESRLASGAGLGLAIVRGLAEANQGRVAYERAAGRTRFAVTLPTPTAAGGRVDLPDQQPTPRRAAPRSQQGTNP